MSVQRIGKKDGALDDFTFWVRNS